MNSSVQDQFYREVSCLLVGSRQKRKGFLQDLRNDLNAYCAENPNADRSAISDHFGEPQELAAEFLSGQREAVICGELQRRKRFHALIALICLLLVLGVGIYCTVDYIEKQNYAHGQFVETITADNPVNSQYEPLDHSTATRY